MPMLESRVLCQQHVLLHAHSSMVRFKLKEVTGGNLLPAEFIQQQGSPPPLPPMGKYLLMFGRKKYEKGEHVIEGEKGERKEKMFQRIIVNCSSRQLILSSSIPNRIP
jgi:hypothetical protein